MKQKLKDMRDPVVVVLGLCIGIASVSWAVVSPDAAQSLDLSTPIVATVKQASSGLQLRPARTLGWRRVLVGADIRDGDAIFVPPGTEGSLVFLDGTVLELDERSLVVVEPPRGAGRTVTVRQGSLLGRAGSQGLTIASRSGRAKLDPKAEARVVLDEDQLQVSVKEGSATVQNEKGGNRQLGSGQRAAVVFEGIDLLPEWSVTLLKPLANERRLFRGAPGEVELSWSGSLPKGARLQLAVDRLFSLGTAELDVSDRSQLIITPRRGVTWWRIVDDHYRPLSESRRLTLMEDVPPVLLAPRTAEVVLAPPGASVLFAWAGLPGIETYRFEISAAQSFEPLVVSAKVSGAQVRQTMQLPEGNWYWRVRAEDASLGTPGFSEARPFRLIHKGIPEAPVLLNPTIEVTPE